MTDDLQEQLKGIDQTVLTDVVRKDQQDPDLVILDWTVEPLGHEKIISTTGGLFCFSGQSQGTHGIQPWKVVLKCINNPKTWKQEPRGWSYWQREILAFKSGFLAQLPAGVRAPRFYQVTENENGAWLWIEHVQEMTGRQWPLDYFHRTARQLGIFQGKYLLTTPLTDQPWLSQFFFRDVWSPENF